MAKLALCIKSDYLLHNLTAKTKSNDGVLTVVDDFANIKNAPSGLISRTFAETDEDYLQIIPYIALRNRQADTYFFYTRGELGEEGRLHGKVSIGIGGHVEDEHTPMQATGATPLESACIYAAYRELREEVGILGEVMSEDTALRLSTSFLNSKVFYSSQDEVSRVHLGLFMTVDIDPEDITELEEGVITKGRWHRLEEIKALQALKQIELEVWTKGFIDLIENNDF
jgi:predicted NUDIX family phosphoesterase